MTGELCDLGLDTYLIPLLLLCLVVSGTRTEYRGPCNTNWLKGDKIEKLSFATQKKDEIWRGL